MTMHPRDILKAPEPGPDFDARLKAHYAAVQARLWHPAPPRPKVGTPPPEPAIDQPRPVARGARDWLLLPPDRDAPLTWPPTMPKRMLNIIRVVAAEYGVAVSEICGPSRRTIFIEPRHEAMLRLYETGRYSTPQIGRAMGGKDHTTVIYGIRRARERRAEKGNPQ